MLSVSSQVPYRLQPWDFCLLPFTQDLEEGVYGVLGGGGIALKAGFMGAWWRCMKLKSLGWKGRGGQRCVCCPTPLIVCLFMYSFIGFHFLVVEQVTTLVGVFIFDITCCFNFTLSIYRLLLLSLLPKIKTNLPVQYTYHQFKYCISCTSLMWGP